MSEDNTLQRAIELCLAVYRVTERFPATETLRFKLRELSLDIIKLSVYSGPIEGFERRIKLLLIYCKISGKQSWIDPRNFDVLCSAYNRLLESSKPANNAEKKLEKRGPKASGLSPRRIQILKFLEENSAGASMTDFTRVIKGKSRKTIERDLKYLIGENLVLKKGRTKGARFFKT